MKLTTIFTALLVAGVCSASAHARDGDSLTVVGTRPIMSMRSGLPMPTQVNAVDPTAFYSNVTTSSNTGATAGGTTLVGSNLVTRMLCDDLQFSTTQSIAHITGAVFTVVNFDSGTVSFRPSIAFFQNDGINGGPGTAAGGVTFGSVTLPTLGATVLSSGPLSSAINVPVDTSNPVVWACQYFDNDSGITGATQAQMDNLGAVFFNPPDIGTSQDLYFGSAGPGSVASDPPGSNQYFGGNPVANFGWELLNADGDTIFKDGFDG